MPTKNLARANVQSLRTLKTGAQDPDTIRLNANEAPDDVDITGNDAGLNRYPPLRPFEIQKCLAKLYAVREENLMVTRGSSEAIDILIRAYCDPGRDSMLILPPTFELYRFFAKIQDIETRMKMLDGAQGFMVDADEVIASCDAATKMIILCSPNNPTGHVIPQETIHQIATARAGQSIVVVDEAYIEFSAGKSLADTVDEFDNIVVLRTLSKAFALAGVRCGAAVSNPQVIETISRVLPPFSFATPVLNIVLDALQPGPIAAARQHIQHTIAERERVSAVLSDMPCVEKVWHSEGNFILFRLSAQERVLDHMHSKGILILGYAEQPGLNDCARVTIGSSAENDAFLAAMREYK